MSSRWVNVVMSMLLVLVGILARGAERASDLALGLSIFVVAFLAMGVVRARRVNTLLGAWAVLSAFAFGYRADLVGWTALAAGMVVVVASLWPDRPQPGRLHPASGRAA